MLAFFYFFFFFQAEDGIRDGTVTGVQTCALPIWRRTGSRRTLPAGRPRSPGRTCPTGRSTAPPNVSRAWWSPGPGQVPDGRGPLLVRGGRRPLGAMARRAAGPRA